MRCKACGNEFAKLARSHIIPIWATKSIRQSNNPILNVGSNTNFPRRLQNGFYDETILCQSCERKFDKIDNDACNLFLREKPELETDDSLVYNEKHKTTALLFIQSLLLRCSYSSKPEVCDVNLGPYEDKFLNAIELHTPSNNHKAIIFKLKRPKPLDGGWMLFPIRTRWNHKEIAYYIYFDTYLSVSVMGPTNPFGITNTFELTTSGPMIIVPHDIFQYELQSLNNIRNHAIKNHPKKKPSS